MDFNELNNMFYGEWNKQNSSEFVFSAQLDGDICSVYIYYYYDKNEFHIVTATDNDKIGFKYKDIRSKEDVYPLKDKAEKIFNAMNIKV